MQAGFGAHPLHLENIFKFVLFLHIIRTMANSTTKSERYPELALCSLMEGASTPSLLKSVGISIKGLPTFNYFVDAPSHLLPFKQEINNTIKEDIY